MAEHHITTDSVHPGWSSEDAVNLRNFLRTPSGSKFLGLFKVLRPGFYSSTVEGRAIESGDVHGWEMCEDMVMRAGLVRFSEKEVPPVEYPDLDSDAGWEPILTSEHHKVGEVPSMLGPTKEPGNVPQQKKKK